MKDDKTRVGSGWQLDDPTPPTVEELIAELDSLIFVDHEKTIEHVDCDKPYLLNLIEKALTRTREEAYAQGYKQGRFDAEMDSTNQPNQCST